MNSTSIGIFGVCESEEKQLAEIRNFFNERGVKLERPGPANIFQNLKEIVTESKNVLTKITNEKEMELLLNSLLSLFISFQEEKLAELVQLICLLLTDEYFRGHGWNSSAGVSLRLLSSLFHLHSDLPALQFIELRNMIQMAGRAKLTSFLDIGTAEIDDYAKKWQLDMEKRRELYRTLHAALCKDESHVQAAEVMVTLLRTYTDKDADKAREDARECVRTAVIDSKSFYFDHLLHLSAVTNLKETDPLMFKILDIFVNNSLAAYQQFTAQNANFVKEQLKVDENLLEKKIKMLTLISMAEKKKVLSLAVLSKELDISDPEELEKFLIDAIRAEAINGKIDDVNGQLTVTFHQQRVFGRAQWEQLQGRMAMLIDNLKSFHKNLAIMIEGD